VNARAAALLTTLLVASCRDASPVPPAPASSSSSSSSFASAPASAPAPALALASALPPLAGDWIEKLPLPDNGLAYVTPPVGAVTKRPVVIAIHGAVDDPGLMCGAWRLVADVYPFVVCPAGTPIGADVPSRRYVWSGADQIDKRALEALAALAAKYPDRVDPDAPVVYAAFSQGATMAAPLLVRQAKRFPRAVFTEGGHHAFEPPGLAQAYAKAGGERVLFTCSQGGCAGFFELSRAALDRAGVAARVVFSGVHGHSMPPPVRESVHDALPWVVEGLAGWEGYAAAPKLPSH
jgi:poly(3-hydroxybutyrate) depolymerase